MLVAFDTSVIVPALTIAHPKHADSKYWLDRIRSTSDNGTTTWHAMAETWSVLTRLPLLPRLSGEVAREVVSRLEPILNPTILRDQHYRDAMKRSAMTGVRSGALYDALHLICAESISADLFLTYNLKDFERLAIPSSPRIITPKNARDVS